MSRTNLRLNEIGAVDADILALTTVSPLKNIQSRYASSLTAPGWTIDKGAGAGFEALVFTINAQNKLRFSINGAATKSATIYGTSLNFHRTHLRGKAKYSTFIPKEIGTLLFQVEPL